MPGPCGSVRGVRILLPLVVCACSLPAGQDVAADAADAADAAEDGPHALHVDDGTPVRLPCTGSFGSALTKTFGRIDGYLVAIVEPDGTRCNSDNNHLMLQVRANGAVYEIAINVGMPGQEDVKSLAVERPLPDPPWQEGWHPDANFDYTSAGLASTALVLASRDSHVRAIADELIAVNRVSIYATAWGGGGAHLVHRNNGRDGVLVTQPLSSPSHMRVFAFTNQTF